MLGSKRSQVTAEHGLDVEESLFLWRSPFRLLPNEAAEWVIIHCKYCNEIHVCHFKKDDEERDYQRQQRAYRKKMRRVDNVWAQRDWLKRLRPRRPKTAR